jgi:type IV fimbrial biogenesis protein FimT
MKRPGRGFSLIEMMITVTIIGVLLALGAPRFAEYLRNAKLRSAAEIFLTGVQLARSEAVRMNTPVEFLLTAADPIPGNEGTAAASASGTNWMVRTADLGTFIDGKFGIEGSGRSTGQVTPVKINDTSAPASADPDAPPAAPVSSIVFNGLGRTNLANQAVFKFNNPDAGTCVTAGGPVRCLKVIVAVGGQARLCDPAVGAAAVAAGDSRGC